MDAPEVQTQGKEYGKGREINQIASLLEESGAVAPPEKVLSDDTGKPEARADRDGPDANQADKVSQPNTIDESQVNEAGDGKKVETGDGEQDGSIVDPENEEKAVSLKELAENLGIETKDLYDVEISLGKDETASLGTLKDAFREYKTLKANEEQIREDGMRQSNEHLVAKRQIEQIIGAVVETGAMTPQLLQHLEAANGQRLDKERRLTLAAIPAWHDEVQRNSDFTMMSETMSEYGYSESEVRGTTDSRQLKAMLDLASMKAAKKRFKAEPTIPTPIKAGARKAPAKSTARERMAAAKASRDHNVKLSAMTELINSR